MEKNFFSTTEVAEILGISRIAVFRKIKSGKIKAEKAGRGFVISREELDNFLGSVLSKESKQIIDEAVKKAVREYHETLKLLGQE